MGKERQLTLDLPHRAALGREDFLVTESNATAVAMIDQWPQWPASAVLLAGPPGCGKSHLTEVWRKRAGASRIASAELDAEGVPQLLAGGAVAVEDAGEGVNERALFHLLNLARQQIGFVLITARTLPAAWGLRLPDLISRLRAVPAVSMGPPDDLLLRGVLVKLFADRQLAVEEAVISYLVARMPRSLEAALSLVEAIDREALTRKAEVTRPFVAQILAGFTSPALFGDGEG
jgi:chromosomal replication initiation ATPase DnaA